MKNSITAEKRTTLLGYFFLSTMSLAIIIVANIIFSDLEEILDRVYYPSHCVYEVTHYDIKSIDRKTKVCDFSKLDRDFKLEVGYNKILPTIEKIIFLNREINSKKESIAHLEKTINNLLAKYNISIKEEIHNLSDKNFDYQKIKFEFNGLENRRLKDENELKKLDSSREVLINHIKDDLESLKKSYESAIEVYRVEKREYNIKLALLEFIFILPLFLIALKLYFKLKAKDSQNTIIFSFIVGALSILLMQILLEFVANILPHHIIELLEELIASFAIFRYIIYYLLLAFVIAIFVVAVYLIQKSIFSKDAIIFKRLKDNLCPKCGFKVNDKYCANCGYEVKIECKSCKNLTFSDMKFCSHCKEELRGEKII